nr:hypothetical protein [Sinorhizobium fredii]
MAFVIIEDRLEQPFCLAEVGVSEPREAIAVLYSLQIAIGGSRSVTLIRLQNINIVAVFRRIVVDDCIALIVKTLAN